MISFTNRVIRIADFIELEQFLEDTPNAAVSFQGCDFNPPVIGDWTFRILAEHKVRRVTLRDFRLELTSYHFRSLAGTCDTIVELDIIGAKIGDQEAFESFAQLIETLTSIQKLSLIWLNLDNVTDSSIIGPPLLRIPRLELGSKIIFDTIMDIIVPSPPKMSPLMKAWNFIWNRSPPAPPASPVSIRNLFIFDTITSVEMVEKLAKALPLMPLLDSLLIFRLMAPSVNSLIPYLSSTRTLRVFGLSSTYSAPNTSFSQQEWNALFLGLANNTSLESLILRRNDITDINCLGRFIESTNTLKRIALDENPIYNIDTFVNALTVNKTLNDISVKRTPSISARSITAWAHHVTDAVFMFHPSLLKVSFKECESVDPNLILKVKQMSSIVSSTWSRSLWVLLSARMVRRLGTRSSVRGLPKELMMMIGELIVSPVG